MMSKMHRKAPIHRHETSKICVQLLNIFKQKLFFESWLAGWLAVWLAGWLAGWLGSWRAGWRAGWLPTWLPTWLAKM